MLNKEERPADRPGFEEIIVRNSIEKIARNYLSLRGDYAPDAKIIEIITNKAINDLKQRYGSIDLIRKEMPQEQLQPAIKKSVELVMA